MTRAVDIGRARLFRIDVGGDGSMQAGTLIDPATGETHVFFRADSMMAVMTPEGAAGMADELRDCAARAIADRGHVA